MHEDQNDKVDDENVHQPKIKSWDEIFFAVQRVMGDEVNIPLLNKNKTFVC